MPHNTSWGLAVSASEDAFPLRGYASFFTVALSSSRMALGCFSMCPCYPQSAGGPNVASFRHLNTSVRHVLTSAVGRSTFRVSPFQRPLPLDKCISRMFVPPLPVKCESCRALHAYAVRSDLVMFTSHYRLYQGVSSEWLILSASSPVRAPRWHLRSGSTSGESKESRQWQ